MLLQIFIKKESIYGTQLYITDCYSTISFLLQPHDWKQHCNPGFVMSTVDLMCLDTCYDSKQLFILKIRLSVLKNALPEVEYYKNVL